MSEVNAKKIFINALMDSISLTDPSAIEIMAKNEEPYFTYVTANGYITGKEMNYEIHEFDEEKPLSDNMLKVSKEAGSSINLISLADLIARYRANQFGKEELSITDKGKQIILEDVTIDKRDGTNPFKTNVFILFLDQVIGVIPAKL
ncbi:hypothetical protein CN637_03885 [Bacillus toyonensis]|uniref:hypothetical protein n=1 Tax=Bacillus toyonensis TaxID=155322 RepID=UPI000BF02338|nr:hypothetical protein [Bacillus toyonensis]PEL71149.1 hypothetical protein CN637_03885 [Bacillus toyonensis]